MRDEYSNTDDGLWFPLRIVIAIITFPVWAPFMLLAVIANEYYDKRRTF